LVIFFDHSTGILRTIGTKHENSVRKSCENPLKKKPFNCCQFRSRPAIFPICDEIVNRVMSRGRWISIARRAFKHNSTLVVLNSGSLQLVNRDWGTSNDSHRFESHCRAGREGYIMMPHPICVVEEMMLTSPGDCGKTRKSGV
jgi:hypothetical protein